MEKIVKSRFLVKNSSKDSAVDVALSIYDHEKTTARDTEIFHSRLCLESLLPEERRGLHLSLAAKAPISTELIRQHYSLNPNFRFDVLENLGTGSLSHTRGLAGFAFSSVGLGIGLDLEWRDREMKLASARLFRHDLDDQHFFNDQSSLLSLWCIKEAAFKALSLDGAIQKTHDHPVLSHIYIRGNEFFHHFDQSLAGFFKQQILEYKGREYVLTLALKNEN